MSVRYPVAPNVEAALARPLGRAEREAEAAIVAGESVAFVSEFGGPAFATREAAEAAYAARLGGGAEDRWCELQEVLARPRSAPAPLKPTYADGRRWPAPPERPPTVWRLSVSYWKAGAEAVSLADQARAMRRSGEGVALDARTLRALTLQPLQPVRPQQPLDVGLFEQRLPEAPHVVIPDE